MSKIEEIRNDYRSSLKSMDTEESIDLIFYRPIGYLWARLARRLGVSPNAITIASIFLGVGAGILMYFPEFWINVLGVLLLVWANTFDSADGQLARMTKQYSKFGRILDGMSGDLWFISIYIALCMRINNTSEFFGEHQWVIWIVAIVAGVCHAKQAAVADYYRQFHLYFVKGDAGSELTTTAQIDEEFAALQWKGNFWKKIFMFFYRHYTANQEILTPQMQELRRSMERCFGAVVPSRDRKIFRSLSKPLMKYTNILTFNTRCIALFISVLSGYPIVYFIFELTVLNVLLVYMMRRHENICRKFDRGISAMYLS